jgi:branched-subunit amino acid ABC-type transport system permease component
VTADDVLELLVGSIAAPLFAGMVAAIVMLVLIDYCVLRRKLERALLPKVLLTLLVSIAAYPCVRYWPNVARSTTRAKVLHRWLESHPKAALAYKELDSRKCSGRCEICGSQSNHALIWTTDHSSQPERTYAGSWPPPSASAYACEDHDAYLALLLKSNTGAARRYLLSHYKGPGSAGLSEAVPVFFGALDQSHEKDFGNKTIPVLLAGLSVLTVTLAATVWAWAGYRGILRRYFPGT